MSLAVIPVCACCGKASPRSTSCTRCFRVCCTACINDFVDAAVAAGIDITLLQDRTCRRCNNDGEPVRNTAGTGTVRTNGTTESSTGSATAGQIICQLHGQVCTLFCLNCSMEVCGPCLGPGELHDLHQVNNLSIVYREKVAKVESKLAEAQKVNADLHSDAGVYGRNLELLEKEVATVVKEIEAMTKRSKDAVSSLTNGRVEKLKTELKLPIEHGAAVDDLQRETKQLSVKDFLQQHPDIDKKCDALIAAQKPITLQEIDDINCDLIPPYLFETIVFRGFLNMVKEGVQTSRMKTAYGFEWQLILRKADKLLIEPSCKLPLSFRYVLLVIIPHTNYTKEIRQTFMLQCNDVKAVEIAETSHILDEKFCNGKGDLVIKIGIRLINVTAEVRLLRHLLTSNAEKYDLDHLIMHFKLKLSKIKPDVYMYSLQIKDEEDRAWRMYVKLESTNLGAHVQLFNGSACSCIVFIELKHNDQKKSVVRYLREPDLFKPSEAWGWASFISWDALNNDDGYHPNDTLHFRFGVRPLPNDSNVPSVCAANA